MATLSEVRAEWEEGMTAKAIIPYEAGIYVFMEYQPGMAKKYALHHYFVVIPDWLCNVIVSETTLEKCVEKLATAMQASLPAEVTHPPLRKTLIQDLRLSVRSTKVLLAYCQHKGCAPTLENVLDVSYAELARTSGTVADEVELLFRELGVR
jgi:hypothetical protein